MAGQMLEMCQLSRVTWQKIAKFPVNILATSVEFVGTWRSVVARNQINKAREEATASVEGNLEKKRDGVQKIGDEPEQSNVEASDASEDDGYCLQCFRW